MGNRMTALVINGDTSGSITLQVPAAAGSGTVHTLPAATGTVMVSGNMPAFSAYASNTLSVSHATWTKVQLNSEEFDTANCFDSTTNYRFTPNVAGYYQVGCYVVYRQSPIIDSFVVLRKNGSTVKTGTSITISSGSNLTNLNFGLNALIYMNGTTDYLEIYALSDGTGNLTFSDIMHPFLLSGM